MTIVSTHVLLIELWLCECSLSPIYKVTVYCKMYSFFNVERWWIWGRVWRRGRWWIWWGRIWRRWRVHGLPGNVPFHSDAGGNTGQFVCTRARVCTCVCCLAILLAVNHYVILIHYTPIPTSIPVRWESGPECPSSYCGYDLQCYSY